MLGMGPYNLGACAEVVVIGCLLGQMYIVLLEELLGLHQLPKQVSVFHYLSVSHVCRSYSQDLSCIYARP